MIFLINKIHIFLRNCFKLLLCKNLFIHRCDFLPSCYKIMYLLIFFLRLFCIFVIYSNSRCPIGSRCTNRRFQSLKYSELKVVKTEKKGLGIQAVNNIPGYVLLTSYLCARGKGHFVYFLQN